MGLKISNKKEDKEGCLQCFKIIIQKYPNNTIYFYLCLKLPFLNFEMNLILNFYFV